MGTARRSAARRAAIVTLVLAPLALVSIALLAGASTAASTVEPNNTSEPQISGTTRVGEVLRTTRGSWTGTPPVRYEYRWFRCTGRGEPDASDCQRIPGETDAAYRLRAADAGHRMRSQVVASNREGQDAATSNPTNVVTSAEPVNTEPPAISGSPVVGQRLTASPGTWTGVKPMTFAFQWLRCSRTGEDCVVIGGETDNRYVVDEQDVGRTLRVRVTAENAQGRTAKRSAQTAVATASTPPPPPSGSTVDVSTVPATARLIVDRVRFSPSPVPSRTDPITVSIRVKDSRGYVIRGAIVFIRSTPRVTSGGDKSATASDGWVTYRLFPNENFPQIRKGFNVQFFVRAYRLGDPALAGIAGTRLVQVPLGG
jgi:hypothetical protein